jgi:hypothetical protein
MNWEQGIANTEHRIRSVDRVRRCPTDFYNTTPNPILCTALKRWRDANA